MQRIEIVAVAVLLLTFILIMFVGLIAQWQQPALGKAAPTTVPFPTFTNTPSAPPAQKAPTAAPSLPPTATPVPPTDTPRPPTVIVNSNMNVRQGPGTNYPVIGGASAGQEFAMTGIESGARQWLQINYNGLAGWVYAPLVTAINAAGVQVAANIPPTPRPTDTPVPAIIQPTNTPVPPPAQPTQVTRSAREMYDDNRNGRINCATEKNRRAQERRDAEQVYHQHRIEDIQRYYDRDREDAREKFGHSFALLNIRLAEIDRDQRRSIEDEQIRHQRQLEEIDSIVNNGDGIVCE